MPSTPLRTPDSNLASSELRPLESLVGAWRGDGKLKAEGKIHPVRMEWTFAPCAGGYALEGTLTVLGIPGVDRCEQKDLIAYDPVEKSIRWISTCNLPEFHDRRGSIDGGTLVVADPKERLRVQVVPGGLSIHIATEAMTAEAQLTR